MPEENTSETPTRKKRAAKRPGAKKSRKRAVKASAAAPPAAAAAPASGDRLTEVARTIGSTVGDIVAKTKKALRRDGKAK